MIGAELCVDETLHLETKSNSRKKKRKTTLPRYKSNVTEVKGGMLPSHAVYSR